MQKGFNVLMRFFEAVESTDYPGVFIFDSSKIESPSTYGYYTRIYVYSEDAVKAAEYVYWDRLTDNARENKSYNLSLYTVSFEQGNIDVLTLPKPKVMKYGDSIATNTFDADYNIPGYEISGYARHGSNDTVSSVDGTMLLHPVFVKAQYSSAKEVTTDEELLDVISNYDSDYSTAIVKGNITLTKEKCLSYLKDKKYSIYGGSTVTDSTQLAKVKIYAENIVIPGDSSLTLNGVYLAYDYGYGSINACNFVLEEGAQMVLTNYSFIDHCAFTVKKNARMSLDGIAGLYNCYGLNNYGKIIGKAPTSWPSVENWLYCMGIQMRDGQFYDYGAFLNAEGAEISLEAGKLKFHLQQEYSKPDDLNLDADDWDSWQDYNTSGFANRGTINITDYAKCELGGDAVSYVQNGDRMLQKPFVNYGTINVKTNMFTYPGSYQKQSWSIDHGFMYNLGEFNIEYEDTEAKPVDLFDTGYYVKAGLSIYCGRLTNQGKITVKALQGVGIAMEQLLYDPTDKHLLEKYKPTNNYQYSGIVNKKNGIIEVSAKSGSLGMAINKDAELVNAGKITFNKIGTLDDFADLTVRVDTTIKNTGTIVNNGIVGYYRSESYSNKKYPCRLVYEGNDMTGSGIEKAAWGVAFYVNYVEDEEYYFPAGTKYDIKINDRTLMSGKLESTEYSLGEDFFIPLGSSVKVSGSIDGFSFDGDTIPAITRSEFFKRIATIHSDGSAEIRSYYHLDRSSAPVSYNIAYVLNGGKNASTNPSKYTKGVGVASFAAPSRSGYKFDGWYSDSSFKTKVTSISATATGDITLYAKWTKSSYKSLKGTKVTVSGVTYKITEDIEGQTGTATITKAQKATKVPTSFKTQNRSFNVTEIGDSAFKGNKAIKTASTGNNIKKIGKNAFNGCTKLKTVKLGKNVTSIGASAFTGCSVLSSVTLGDKLTTIGDKAFYNLPKLTKITIPSGVNKIGKSAFEKCKALKSITIKTTLLTDKNVGSKAFASINASAKVKVPKAKLKDYQKLLKKKGISGKKQKITK